MTIRRGHQEDNDRAMTILNTADVGDRDVMERSRLSDDDLMRLR